jgi:hypothetical protein
MALPNWGGHVTLKGKRREEKRRGEKKDEPPNQKKPPKPMSLDSKATEQEGDNNKIPKYLW